VLTFIFHPQGRRERGMVRALASRQCGPGSIPGLSIIFGDKKNKGNFSKWNNGIMALAFCSGIMALVFQE